jgi:VWFA-related protein
VKRLGGLLMTVVGGVVSAGLLAVGFAQAPVFRADVDLVRVGVTVTDRRGALVTDLRAGDFVITEDGEQQEITSFAIGRGQPGPPLHLAVLLDVSESMSDDLGFTKTAALRFLGAFADAVDITVVDFDTEVHVARYSQRDFTRVIDRIRGLRTGRETALYDAIAVYLDAALGQAGRTIMLLYTDGGNTTSAIRFGELVNLLKASDVTVYAIGQLEHQPQSARSAQRRVLQQISETTGGEAFFPLSPKDLDAAYDAVSNDINAQYLLGYRSTNRAADGKWRKVEVKVAAAGGYRLRAREGYFAPYTRPS